MLKTTMPTLKRLSRAIRLAFDGVDVPTSRASLRSVCGWDKHDWHTSDTCLVPNKQSQLHDSLFAAARATREDIIAFIKKAKTKKYSPKILDVCKKFENTNTKPVLPDDAPVAVVLFAGGGIEAGMVQAGIRPVIAVEFDPSKPELSQAIASVHHHNFSEYGCKVIQRTVQVVAQSGFIGFPQSPDYLHASSVCANFSQAHTAKAGKSGENSDDLTGAIAYLVATIIYRWVILTWGCGQS